MTPARADIVVSCIDNMVKGAAGQAIQNMNLLYGLDEGAGLALPPGVLTERRIIMGIEFISGGVCAPKGQGGGYLLRYPQNRLKPDPA